MSGINEASSAPDWLLDLSRAVRQPMRDPRLDNARAALIDIQARLVALDTEAKQVEAVLRDCAEIGMTSEEIAVRILSMEVVNRVLNGGSLLGTDYD
ncbi:MULTISPECIES: hypothetical protein [Cryobacterium]|uniref:hypothetical protein n=1 Tax=Cryobacterium TaxID=69578 RepID=UPI000CD409DA|nr:MULTISPECIES: hypothetical protein [Cryobacterium]TFC46258.1 hypothetical protein E3O57_06945 [Cryobacterium sp. TMN-39-2]